VWLIVIFGFIQQAHNMICVSVTDVAASVAAHEYFLKVVPTVVDEVGGKGPLYACQYTYAKRVSV